MRSREEGNVCEVTSQLDVPTSLTPAHLLCFHFMGCEKEVSDLIKRPVMRLLDTWSVLLESDERLKTKSEKSTSVTYTGLLGELEHLKIKTRLINEMFVCECDG